MGEICELDDDDDDNDGNCRDEPTCTDGVGTVHDHRLFRVWHLANINNYMTSKS
jgi:hypothetical protein